MWVLRVCQQSEKHLDKISNVDEFVRRVYSVIHSNDPIARALTLRTLGAVAGIIPERQQVHHSIRRSLDSHDNVEVEAAIYAAIQFAAQSKSVMYIVFKTQHQQRIIDFLGLLLLVCVIRCRI